MNSSFQRAISKLHQPMNHFHSAKSAENDCSKSKKAQQAFHRAALLPPHQFYKPMDSKVLPLVSSPNTTITKATASSTAVNMLKT